MYRTARVCKGWVLFSLARTCLPSFMLDAPVFSSWGLRPHEMEKKYQRFMYFFFLTSFFQINRDIVPSRSPLCIQYTEYMDFCIYNGSSWDIRN